MNNENWNRYEADGDDYIPMEEWGQDHWSTFAYLECRAADYKGVISNEKLRCNPRLHRHFAHAASMTGSCPNRTKERSVEKHDDWSCIEDMVAAGLIISYFTESSGFGGSKARIELTDLGYEISAQLRRHKCLGGSFSTFVPLIEVRTL